MTAHLLQELSAIQKKMKHNYEKRLLIVGLSEFLQNEILPETAKPHIVSVLNSIIDSLMQIAKEENREAKRKSKAEMDQDD